MPHPHTTARKETAVPPRGRRLVRLGALGGAVFAAWLVFFALAPAQQMHRNGFETRTLSWQKGSADVPYKEAIHEITDQTAHGGQFSERIQLTAEVGTYIHYVYPVGRAPISEEMGLSLWVKGNRQGPQLLARLVLPRERKPDNINEPLTVLLRGDQYQLVGRWERLELRKVIKLAKEQQQLLRLELKREVDFSEAYIDQLIVNAYGGPGLTELWLDDLEAGPVFEESTPKPPVDAGGTPGLPTAVRPPTAPRGAAVELNQDHLIVGGKRFLFRGIRRTDTPLKTLRDAGFNCIWLDATTTAEEMEEAINLGFWLVPTLPLQSGAATTLTSNVLGREVSRFLHGDAVLFWDLGGGRTIEEAPGVGTAAQAIRGLDPGRPLAADIWDGFLPYARHVDLVGAHRWPLMTSLELPQYREWLNQRRQLAQPRSSFQWTWVQTHLPDWYTTLVYDRKADAVGKAMTPMGFNEPVGPQAEQIRLLTYTALASGCQGLGFWSDRFLADSYQGRDRLLALALLNQELHMLEPLLLSAVEPPTWVGTSHPEVQAAVFRTEKGVLVLPMWLGKGAQYVPGQSAAAKLSITVPQVPTGTQAWEITPGEVRSLQSGRVVGGTQVYVPEFGLTTAIVFTSDNSPTGMLVRFQDHCRRSRKLAAQWAHDLAEVEMEKVLKVQAELERAGHTLPDGQALQDDAKKRLQASVGHWNNGDFRGAYLEAQRALRPLRILMRAQWEQAVKGLDSPVASPYAVSFFTLPKHWELMGQVQQSQPGANVLTGGDFENDARQSGWLPQEVTIDDVELWAWRVGTEQEALPPRKEKPKVDAGGNPEPPAQPPSITVGPREGQRALKLEIRPKKPQQAPAALERTFLAINSPAVNLQPGTLVRISAWVRVPRPITASVDGALFYDSVGGEPLAIRLTEATPWKRFTLYRRVPASGTISVTLAMTGIGVAYFDDVRIEPLTPDWGAVAPTQWRRPGGDAAAPKN